MAYRHNPQFEQGIHTSRQLAFELALTKNKPFLLTLGDLPMVTEKNYLEMISLFNKTQKTIFSTFETSATQILGPPAIFSVEDVSRLLSTNPFEKPAEVLKNFITYDNPNAALDIDRPEDLANLESKRL